MLRRSARMVGIKPGGSAMTNSARPRRRIPPISLHFASATLALTIMLPLTIITPLPTQSQSQFRARQTNHPPDFKTFTVLHSFTGGADGGSPYSPMTLFYRIGYLHYANTIFMAPPPRAVLPITEPYLRSCQTRRRRLCCTASLCRTARIPSQL
jgi:hypothetical protein